MTLKEQLRKMYEERADLRENVREFLAVEVLHVEYTPFKKMPPPPPKKKLDPFDVAYQRLSRKGLCDSPGGAEYRRVKRAWTACGKPSDIEQFILLRANEMPNFPG